MRWYSIYHSRENAWVGRINFFVRLIIVLQNVVEEARFKYVELCVITEGSETACVGVKV